jgi:hypothetical protein
MQSFVLSEVINYCLPTTRSMPVMTTMAFIATIHKRP